ncbi:hypothetical protein [Sphingobium sp. CAP-1]|uniref:hypothetical protein n=1 Tax=Sphingobium sp. CAP-1 TaxID=2676077 RepID=UPI0012BB3B5D|nr:hypothetical protein [Sphingobium sp. CAP-1]QGP79982.1 hypothetical protein GL174_14070 [Sphingobium sp. CAP-1]
MPVSIHRPRSVAAADEVITPADIEAWARVERALSARREACRKRRVGHAAMR